MHSLADSYAFWITLVAALGVLYILPSLIGALRRVEYLGYLIALNLLGGLAAIGWSAALICALILPRRRPHHRPTTGRYPIGQRPG